MNQEVNKLDKIFNLGPIITTYLNQISLAELVIKIHAKERLILVILVLE